MRFSFFSDDLSGLQTDVIGLLCFEDKLGEGTFYQGLDRALDGQLTLLGTEEGFKGKKGQSLLVHSLGKVGCARVLLIGGGARPDFQAPDLRGFAARVVKVGASVAAKNVTLVLPYSEGTVQERAAQFLAEGALLGRYKFDKYFSDEHRKNEAARIEECRIAMSTDNVDARRLDTIRKGVQRGEQVAIAVAFARDLVNEPAAYMTPSRLAEIARDAARDHHLELKILGPKECEKLGMGMYLAVAQGSDEEPRFIHLTYRPKGKATPKKRVALIGKGVTFDSGGLSIKTSAGMEDMKVDMAGAAAVIAGIGVLADLGSPHEIHAIAACTENMISGKSYKLGDVLKSMSGKTVEITNTDAEGRLTLGDAITYALREVAPDEIFDFATLTAAVVVALGKHIAGVMGNDLSLVEHWLAAARRAGEEMWQLPLPERMKEQIKSDIADLRNVGDRFGAALTAGVFLREFAGTTPWVHVDLAGPASADKEYGHISKGGTGFSVATMVEYLASRD